MRVSYPRRVGLATGLILALGLHAALAQTEPSKIAERPWTDPPARSAPPAASPEAKPQAATSHAARSENTKSENTKSARPARAVATAPQRVRRSARAPSPAAPSPAMSQRPRLAEMRARPRLAERPVYTYRRASTEIQPVGRGGFGMDERSRRIRAAEEAGFLVVRSRTIEFPDGRRIQTYSPYEPEDTDD